MSELVSHTVRSIFAPGVPDSPGQAAAWLGASIAWARKHRATDAHFLPCETDAALWLRIDGRLCEVARYPLPVHARVVARLKVLGRCADYDGEMVQEGRFALEEAGGGEFRLSVIGTLRGEKAVVRLMPPQAETIALEALGFSETMIEMLRAAMDRPQGLLLAIGPSGSGKTTALYALLDDLRTRLEHPLSVVTIEDPVERSLCDAAQVAIDPARGLDIASGLRAVLRQDPEVVMVGEIRDHDTAQTAFQAALTGHRLLSSMHTLNAPEALVRLRQMGVAPYVIASALGGVLNVRLVRTLCEKCRRTRTATGAERVLWPEVGKWESHRVPDLLGCDACLNTGIAGRTALSEWVASTDRTVETLREHGTLRQIGASLETRVSARHEALDLMKRGLVTPGECQATNGFATLEDQGGAHDV